jgi:release factor glutamine methyltransferase
LSAFRDIASQSASRLCNGGWLLLEHGMDQGAEVRQIIGENAFGEIESLRDLAGHERVTLGRLAVGP